MAKDKYYDPRRARRERRPEYHLRNVILGEDLVEQLFAWHGGQNTYVYSLASVGMSNLVSPSMIDAAADELMRPGKYPLKAKYRREKDELIATLQDLADYPDEHTAEEAGLSTSDSGYATWLMGRGVLNPSRGGVLTGLATAALAAVGVGGVVMGRRLSAPAAEPENTTKPGASSTPDGSTQRRRNPG